MLKRIIHLRIAWLQGHQSKVSWYQIWQFFNLVNHSLFPNSNNYYKGFMTMMRDRLEVLWRGHQL